MTEDQDYYDNKQDERMYDSPRYTTEELDEIFRDQLKYDIEFAERQYM